MFSKLSSLALIVVSACVVTTSARPLEEGITASIVAVEHGKGIVPPAPNFINLVQVCTEANFGNCFVIFFNTVPSGCINLPTLPGAGALQDSISSAFPIAGVQCTLFQDIDCRGASLRVSGDIPNFENVGFNDITTSLSCVAN